MEQKAIRTIDELGRINLPRDLRLKLGWETGTALSIYLKDDTIVLRYGVQWKKSGTCTMPGLKTHTEDCDVCGRCE